MEWARYKHLKRRLYQLPYRSSATDWLSVNSLNRVKTSSVSIFTGKDKNDVTDWTSSSFASCDLKSRSTKLPLVFDYVVLWDTRKSVDAMRPGPNRLQNAVTASKDKAGLTLKFCNACKNFARVKICCLLYGELVWLGPNCEHSSLLRQILHLKYHFYPNLTRKLFLASVITHIATCKP